MTTETDTTINSNTGKEVFHDKQTNALYIIEGLDSSEFNLVSVLKENKITGSNSESQERAGVLLAKSMDLQKEVCQKISQSVGKPNNPK